jgi:hypothetical protein
MPVRRRAALLAIAASLLLAGCDAADGGDAGGVGVEDAAPGASTSPPPFMSVPWETPPIGSVGPSTDPTAKLCEGIAAVGSRLSVLAALELRPTARVTLDIELSRVQVSFSELREDALDARELELDDTVRRLGYRLDDLALAVEDFRTTSRPRDAARHVATDAAAFADALAGFELQTGC